MLYQYSNDDIRHGKPAFPVHIDNKKPRIKPKRQPGIGSASWQYASLWVIILPVRSQYASECFNFIGFFILQELTALAL